MDYPKKLTVEQKIKMIREFKDIGQIELGEVIGVSDSTICRYESDAEEHKHLKYTVEHIIAFKKHFGIKHAPILDEEYPIYKTTLYGWLTAMRDENTEESDILKQELSDIFLVPWDFELTLLYLIFEAKWLLLKARLKEAEEKLKLVRKKIENASNEVLYEFYYTCGSLGIHKENYDEALNCFLEAEKIVIDGFDMSDKEIALEYNIAYCYSEIGKYVNSIAILDRTCRPYNFKRANTLQLNIFNLLALNYMRLGNTEKAMQLFDRGLTDATSLGINSYILTFLHNIGCTYFNDKNYRKALDYFDKVLGQIEKGHKKYLVNFYFKACCLSITKRHDLEIILQHGKSISKDNEVYAMLFEALSHLRTLKEKESLNFVQNEVIPYLIKKRKYSFAIFYCERVKEYYISRTRTQKVLEMDSVMLDITRKMLK